MRTTAYYRFTLGVIALWVLALPASPANARPLPAAASPKLAAQLPGAWPTAPATPSAQVIRATKFFTNDPQLILDLVWNPAPYSTMSVAWGDVDNDGDLDLAVGNHGAHNRLYRNQGGVLTLDANWNPNLNYTTSLAWGDVDNDDDLDLVVGNDTGRANQLYRNQGGALTLDATWNPTSAGTTSVAWGDVDGDGDLDLAVGSTERGGQLYRNNGGVLTLDPAWNPNSDTTSLAWGDVDNDGDLDLAMGNGAFSPQRSALYINQGGELVLDLVWNPAPTYTTSVVWGDVDNDGDLDLAVSTAMGLELYRNSIGILIRDSAWQPPADARDLAWGDADGDGDLDLAVTSVVGPNQLYRNNGGGLTLDPTWDPPAAQTTSLAWGDVDNDGDLDLAVGNAFITNQLYRNQGGGLALDANWNPNLNYSGSVAWGDVDNDGDLDLVVGNYGGTNQLYRNSGGGLTLDLSWNPTPTGVESLAWGDVDNDGDLDLAVGNASGANQLYRNTGGTLTLDTNWNPAPRDTTSVAWGDVDGDGDLDLAVGNISGYPNQLYWNNNGTFVLAPWNPAYQYTTSLAWGDVDGDGDLDLAVGNYGRNQLYRNLNGVLTLDTAWNPDPGKTSSLAWGDVDGDGDLDLAVGNGVVEERQRNQLYRNTNGVLTLDPTWDPRYGSTTNLAWGDVDGDGDLDLAVVNQQSTSQLYRNQGGRLTLDPTWNTAAYYTFDLAWGDMDNDGDLDLALANWSAANQIYRNGGRGFSRLPNNPTWPALALERSANFFATAQILETSIIPITYTLADPEGSPVRTIRAYYSPDGGGKWYTATAASGTLTTNLTTTSAGTTHLFKWDVFASGFFGQTDNMVFRIEAYPSHQPLTNSVPGLQHPYAAATTFPFRVRGTQIRVMSGTVPVGNALVYRLAPGQTLGGALLTDNAGQVYRTNALGYVLGRAQVNVGDRLVALLPLSATSTYTLYATSAAPTLSGLNMYTVTAAGVQTLNVTSTYPLLLFNLDVSLEWDAHLDQQYLETLKFNLQRTSEILYDYTNGQAALGQLRIYQNRDQWNQAHIRIYANNRLRPFASIGGIANAVITDPVTSTLHYAPGQVSMAATWNRYGNPGTTLGEDWPRTLAHELGHYLFYQDDNYLGLNAQRRLQRVATCTGSIMADSYRDDYSELHPRTNWATACAATLSNQATGRADWETVVTFYPALQPLSNTLNAGPTGMPLALTTLTFMPAVPTTVLADPRFYLTDSGGSGTVVGRSAQAFLFQPDHLVDLGSPVVGSVLARGAAPGNVLCIFDPLNHRQGCKTVNTSGDQTLALLPQPNWNPAVTLTPLTTQTLAVAVSNVPTGLTLQAQVYTKDDLASAPFALTAQGNGYTGTITLMQPVFNAHVRVWVAGDPVSTQRTVVADYALGGSPGDNSRIGKNDTRVGGTNQRSGFAPVLSGDGQVLLYTQNITFPAGTYYALQGATYLPNVPTWVTPVGRGYWLVASAGAPTLSGASLSMGYADSDVPTGGESGLRVYTYVANTWQALTSTVDADDNSVVAVINGPGLYALMTSVEIPLYGPGWNNIAYPLQTTQTVTNGMASIAGSYTVLYNYVANTNEWLGYAPGVPGYVNTLHEMSFGRAYWLYATQSVNLQLGGAGTTSLAVLTAPLLEPGFFPPTTYYGSVLASNTFTPTTGMLVEGYINGLLCGQGQVLSSGNTFVYALRVLADTEVSGCGAVGRTVTFGVDGVPMLAASAWDNRQVWRVDMGTDRVTRKLYLPRVSK